MNVYDMIASAERDIESAKQRREDARKEIEALLDTAESAERDQRVDALFAEIKTAKADVTKHEARLADFRAMADEDEALAKAARTVQPHAEPSKRTAEFQVGNEPMTYTPQSDPTGKQFLADVITSQLYNDRHAGDRIERHMREERVERGAKVMQARSAGSGGVANTDNFGSIVVPQYLIDMLAPATANLRPFADVCNHHPLPAEGMTVTIPRITTATSAALQANQFDDVSHTSIAETDLVITVQTAAGRQNVSLQAIQRGTGVESVVLQDLFARYNTAIDSTMINQGTHGLSAVAASTLGTYTDASPTGVELYPKLLAAASGVEATLLSRGRPDYVVMTSARWYWLAKEMTSSWPLINSVGVDPRTAGKLDPTSTYNSGVRGVLPNGMLVIVDNNVPNNLGGGTNQDEIYVVSSNECHLWEQTNAPAYIRAEQPLAANLGVQLVVYGFFAYTFERYPSGAMQKVSGTGLTSPVF